MRGCGDDGWRGEEIGGVTEGMERMEEEKRRGEGQGDG